MSQKIYVGKLPQSITGQQLVELFSQSGTVVSAKVVQVISFQENMNYGYVQMSSDDETKKAIRTFNNTVLENSHIKVLAAHLLDQERSSYYQFKKRTFHK